MTIAPSIRSQPKLSHLKTLMTLASGAGIKIGLRSKLVSAIFKKPNRQPYLNAHSHYAFMQKLNFQCNYKIFTTYISFLVSDGTRAASCVLCKNIFLKCMFNIHSIYISILKFSYRIVPSKCLGSLIKLSKLRQELAKCLIANVIYVF